MTRATALESLDEARRAAWLAYTAWNVLGMALVGGACSGNDARTSASQTPAGGHGIAYVR